MSAAKTKAQGIIDDNAVGMFQPSRLYLPLLTSETLAVFSKSYCPYCSATKTLLSDMGAKYYAIELDQIGKLISGWCPRYSFC